MKKLTKQRIPWIIMTIFIVLGLSFSIYLTILHAKVYLQTGYAADSSICSISDRVNCEVVAENPYSIFFGVPVSVWGMIGYILMGLGAVLGIRKPKSKELLFYMFGLTGFSILVSFTLGYISITQITSICIFCFATYSINLILLLTTWGMLYKLKINPVKAGIALMKWGIKKPWFSAPFIIIGLLTVGILHFKYPKYWKMQEINSDDLTRLAHGVDKEGHQWLGARYPLITVVEYSDYECPFCSRKHQFLRKLINKYPEKIRLVHQSFPLDTACNDMLPKQMHPSACIKAKMAICAGKQNKFWETNDLFFANRHKRFSPYLLSQKLNLDFQKLKSCVKSKETSDEIQKTISYAKKHHFTGTPVLYANGKRFRSTKTVEKMLKDFEGVNSSGNYWIGAKNPKVTIDSYSDYECPHCKKFHKIVRRLISKYHDKLRLVHHHYPLDKKCNRLLNKPFHHKACLFSQYVICAGDQNKFWEANDYVFRHRRREFTTKEMATELKLDAAKLESCITSPKIAERLKKDIEKGISLGINGTPTFFINNEQIPNKYLAKRIEKLLQAK